MPTQHGTASGLFGDTIPTIDNSSMFSFLLGMLHLDALDLYDTLLDVEAMRSCDALPNQTLRTPPHGCHRVGSYLFLQVNSMRTVRSCNKTVIFQCIPLTAGRFLERTSGKKHIMQDIALESHTSPRKTRLPKSASRWSAPNNL